MKSHFRIAGLLVSFLLMGALAVRASAAEITEETLGQHIATAKTSADYQSLADFYRAQAKKAEDRVKMHERMLDNYKKRGGKPYLNMKTHCKAILSTSRALQSEYESLALQHEQMAQELKGK